MDKNLKELFNYNNGNILLDGYDLVKYANMHVLSTKDFLSILRKFLEISSYGINCNCQLLINEDYIFDEKTKMFNKVESGIMLVNEDMYDYMKYQIFKLAFINCSNLAISEDDFIADVFNDSLKKLLLYIRKNFNKKYTNIHYHESSDEWAAFTSVDDFKKDDIKDAYYPIKKRQL